MTNVLTKGNYFLLKGWK